MDKQTEWPIRPGDNVVYVPTHANGVVDHPDCEEGFVTSRRGDAVWCRFWHRNHAVRAFPGEATRMELRTVANSERCDVSDLVKVGWLTKKGKKVLIQRYGIKFQEGE